MRQMFLFFTLLTILITGCESPQQSSAPTETTAPGVTAAAPTEAGIFHQPTTPHLLELPSEALAYWRTAQNEKPALVLFSFDPLLKQIAPSLQQRARELAITGNPEQLRQHGSFNTAEPLILPVQTVAAAIDAGFFAKIYWVFPSKVQPEQLDLAMFRSQMSEQQILTAAEIAGINLNNGVYTGVVRGVPFEALHYQMLRDIPEPLVLHIDMSFFRGLYDNEIKSPLYTLLRDTVESIRARNWQPLATTLSYSTLEGAIALEVRFVMNNLAEIFRDPTLLDGDMPQVWQLRSEALYAGDMYSESKQIELSQQMLQLKPQSAAVQYDRFSTLFMDKQIEPALQALAQAVVLDPGYAAAYIQLAQMAAQDGNTGKALELLGLAEQRFPENPFITLQKAHLLTFNQQYSAAKADLAKLPQQWSQLFHANIPQVITELHQQIAAETGAEQKSEK